MYNAAFCHPHLPKENAVYHEAKRYAPADGNCMQAYCAAAY